ncbi:hypothetical protein V1525DRAFT_321739, partial [Lipomyces kononenkoae]
LEEKGSQCDMPFYTVTDLGFSDFKSIKLMLADGSKGKALIYLYHYREDEDENVAFVSFDRTGYHYAGDNILDFEQFKEAGGQEVVVDFGSCEEGEYPWHFHVASTEAAVGGYVKRN